MEAIYCILLLTSLPALYTIQPTWSDVSLFISVHVHMFHGFGVGGWGGAPQNECSWLTLKHFDVRPPSAHEIHYFPKYAEGLFWLGSAALPCPFHGPTVGALNAESPKITLKNNKRNGHEIGVSYGFASYFACAKLYTFPMVAACALAPSALQTPSKPRFNVRQFSNLFFHSFWEPLGLWFHGATVGPWGR